MFDRHDRDEMYECFVCGMPMGKEGRRGPSGAETSPAWGMEASCWAWAYWVYDRRAVDSEEAILGKCCRQPPRLGGKGSCDRLHPLTSHGHWCGEFLRTSDEESLRRERRLDTDRCSSSSRRGFGLGILESTFRRD